MAELARLIAVVGPTGAGKTALAEELARAFTGELVSADAVQIYRGMDIGTAKERSLRVPQHLIDICEPGEQMTAARYQELAYRTIDQVLDRGKLPILVGGSMLYLDAVVSGYLFGGRGTKGRKSRYQTLLLGIDPGKEVLAKRLEQRTATWLEKGLLQEITMLLNQGVSPAWLVSCGMEYRYFTQHLQGELSLEEATHLTNVALRQYVKRQRTWWRHHGPVAWVADAREAATKVEAFLQ